MATSTPAESDQDWVANMRYVGLPIAEAAADPRTPERYLLESGLRSLEQYLAMTGRPNLSGHLTRRLIWWADAWPGERADHPAAVVAACALPGASTHDIIAMARSLPPATGVSSAVAALAAHPSCTNEALTWALTAAIGSDAERARAAAAAQGSFVPYAQKLNRGSFSTLGHEVDAIVDTADSIDQMFPDPDVRRAAAQVSLTFEGAPSQLAQVVHAALVTEPATAA